MEILICCTHCHQYFTVIGLEDQIKRTPEGNFYVLTYLESARCPYTRCHWLYRRGAEMVIVPTGEP